MLGWLGLGLGLGFGGGGCNAPGVLLSFNADPAFATQGRLDAYCVSLGADGARRFGRRYTTAEAPLPQTLGVRAEGRSAVVARLDGYAAGLRVGSRAASFPLGEGQADTASLTLTSCEAVACASTCVVEGAQMVMRAVLPFAAQGLAVARTGAEAAGAAELLALSAQAGVRARYSDGRFDSTPLAGGAGAAVRALLALDTDGDCADDLVVVSDGRAPAVWPSDTAGLVAADPARIMSTAPAAAVAVADVGSRGGGRDGVTDLVAVGAERPSVLAGDMNGYTELQDRFDVDPLGARAVAFGDLDGDGLGDLLIGFANGPLRWWRGDGSGHFTVSTAAVPGSFDVTALALRDLDSDGDLDAIVTVSAASASAGPGLRLFFNNGRGTFVDNSAVVVPASVEPGLRGLVIADVDGDCTEEMILVGETQPPGLFGFDSTGFLDDRGSIGSVVAAAVAVGDLDGDGIVEVAVAGPSQITLWSRGSR